MSLSESLKIAGQPVVYVPRLAKPLGSVNASILFGYFFNWSDKGASELGICRTAEEIEAETGLTRDEQRTARAKLRERGVLIETEKRIEHRIYYKLDLSAFDELMKNFQACANPQSAKSTIPNPEVGNSQSGSGDLPIDEVGNSQSYIRTEDYQKTTTVDYYSNNAHAEACAAAPDDKPSEKATAKRRAKNRDADDLALLTEYGVSVQTAEDYLIIRKAKRLPLTKTALLQIQAEANKAGLTVEQALVYSIGNGWASFRAEWLQNRMGNAAKTNEPSHKRFADKTTTPATTPGMRPLGKM